MAVVAMVAMVVEMGGVGGSRVAVGKTSDGGGNRVVMVVVCA